jgi:hypothetical protein
LMCIACAYVVEVEGVLQILFKLLEYEFCWSCIACEVERSLTEKLSFYFFHNENLLSKFHERFSINTFYKLLEYDFCWMCIACAYVVEVERVSYKYYLFLFIRTRTSYEILSKVLIEYFVIHYYLRYIINYLSHIHFYHIIIVILL